MQFIGLYDCDAFSLELCRVTLGSVSLPLEGGFGVLRALVFGVTVTASTPGVEGILAFAGVFSGVSSYLEDTLCVLWGIIRSINSSV